MPAAVTLVIVDDNIGSLELLSTALEQPGLNIYTASDPEVALDLIVDKHAQIVLTDLVMPKMTGLEFLERVISFDPAIEVILMTAHYSSESAVEAIRKGASDYLDKPVSLPVLPSNRSSAQVRLCGKLFPHSADCPAFSNCAHYRAHRFR